MVCDLATTISPAWQADQTRPHERRRRQQPQATCPTRSTAEQPTHCVLTLRFPPRYAPIEDGAIDHRLPLTQAITTNEIHTV